MGTPVQHSPPLDARAVAAMRRISNAFAAAAAIAGVAALASHPLGSPWIRTLGHPIEMQPNAALGLALAGGALLLQRGGGQRTALAARLLAAGVAALGAATLAQHALGIDLGVDTVFFRSELASPGTTSPGRMGPPAAASFLVAGAAILALGAAERGARAAQALALAMAAVPLVGIVGYAYGVGVLYAAPRVTAIAIPTAVAILALDLAVLLARPERGFMARLATPGSGAALARRILVAAVALPFTLGWLALVAASGHEREALAVSLLVVGVTIGIVVLVFRDAAGVAEAEAARLRAETEREASRAALAQALEREREARAAAETASRAKDLFLATLSHELRTPLNAILGWSGLLRGAPADPQRVERGLGVIERNGRALARLLSDLLDMSLIASGRLELRRADVDLATIVEEEIEAAGPAASAKGVALSRTGARAAPVTGDAARLGKAVSNLLSNAVKFTPPGGRIDVRVDHQGEMAVLDVADTGLGIAAEFLPRIFDPFSQADGTTARRHGGLGLGLAIAHEVVALHGGEISARSGGPGQGATFRIVLPSRPASAGDRPALGGARILVVDDEADSRDLLVQLLASWGARASGAGTAKEALAALERERPDLLVSDIAMPGDDGYALIAEVRRLERAKAIAALPAAALTAFARPEDRDRVLAAGFDAHVAKPIEPRALLATIAALLRPAGEVPRAARSGA
jgi:signal transduction histidine kinase